MLKHRAYLIDYKGSSTSVDLNSLLRIIIPSCPLVVGVILDLDVVSPWKAHYLLKFRCCRPKLREACLYQSIVSCWILLCPLSYPGMSETDLQVPEKKIESRKVGFFMVVLTGAGIFSICFILTEFSFWPFSPFKVQATEAFNLPCLSLQRKTRVSNSCYSPV